MQTSSRGKESDMWDQHKDCMAGSMGGKEEAGEIRKVRRRQSQHRGAESILMMGRSWRDECRIMT